ncbi:hypothetical protein BJ170DRAFT_120813 [Xylariales sp. AK1849]|nr:hypothetical protein BJ170DRAFT_120813 [Xylariales sp. AK1849]
MMHSLQGMGILDHAPQVYSTGPSLDEFSRQQAISESARRISRGSNGYRPTNAMRVVKPSSANNSPQAMMQRRRTLMNDGNLARRRQYALDQAFLHQQLQGAASPYDAYQEPVKKTNRPVSWHPSSHIQQPQTQLQQLPHFDISQYAIPASTPYSEADLYSGYQHFPPTPVVYSGHTSPASTFSPLSLPYTTSSQPQIPPHYVSTDNWIAPVYSNPTTYATNGSPGTMEPFPPFAGQSSFNWETFTTHGFNSGTTPPTPDNYQPVPSPMPTVPSEESIPYQALDEPEEEGEILIGMGLYDTPGKSETDPELDHYRTTASHLLGMAYRKGAGLKLEEAWEPPKDDEADSEDDADTEEQEEDCSALQPTDAQQSWI